MELIKSFWYVVALSLVVPIGMWILHRPTREQRMAFYTVLALSLEATVYTFWILGSRAIIALGGERFLLLYGLIALCGGLWIPFWLVERFEQRYEDPPGDVDHLSQNDQKEG